MKISRIAWVVVTVAAAGVALFLYSQNSVEKAPPHSVTLQWTVTPGADWYNVYRATTSGGPFAKIDRTFAPPYYDRKVTSGATYYYVVTTVRKGKESRYSSEIKASVP